MKEVKQRKLRPEFEKRSEKITSHRLPKLLEFALVLLVLLEIIASFTSEVSGVDAGYHLTWIRGFTSLVSQGVYIPRWLPQAFYGFGGPTFYFYPPLTYYLAFILRSVTSITNPVPLFQATSLVATIMSFVATWILLRSLNATKYQSILGSVIYTFAPYRVAELYSMASLSSHFAYVFIPLVWYGLIKLANTNSLRTYREILLLAISIALLVLTNIPVALLTAISVVVVSLFCAHNINKGTLRRVLVAVLLSIGLCCFYLLPILEFKGQTQLTHLTDVREYFIDDLIHGRNIPGLYHLVVLYAAILVLVISYRNARKKRILFQPLERRIIRGGFLVCSLILIMELPMAAPWLFSAVPGFQLIQGTWRFYIDIVLFCALVVGIASSEELVQASRKIVYLWTLAAIPLMFLIIFNFHLYPHHPLDFSEPAEYVPIYALSNHRELDSILRSHATDLPLCASYLESGEHLKQIVNLPYLQKYDVVLLSTRNTISHRFYWPAWHLYANAKEIKTHPDSIGRATALLPAGHYTIEWKLERLPLEMAGLWVSGISWTGILLLSGIGLVRRRVKRHDPSSEA
jgi:hypothetical protein